MKRWVAVAAVLAVSGLMVGCASLNPFGSSKSKRAMAPSSGTEAAVPGEPVRARRPAESLGLVRFDANSDGAVTRAELEQVLAADFKKDDVNGDEALDVVETRALNERIRAEKTSSPVFDWNADGRLVYSEFASQWRTLFQRSDINTDGTVDDEELQGRRRELKPRPLPTPGFSGKDGRPPGTD
jgi:Ca2+-binding EF-hand superfamily protein